MNVNELKKIETLKAKISLTDKEQKELNSLLEKQVKEAAGLLSADVWGRVKSAPLSSIGLSIEPECNLSLGKVNKFNFGTYLNSNKSKPNKVKWATEMRERYGDDFMTVQLEFVGSSTKVETSVFLPTLKILGDNSINAITEDNGVMVADNDNWSFGMSNGVPIALYKGTIEG